ncbi:pilus assembly protein CpaB [Thermomonospora echinospora]|uniref:Pilus assembly protein CpaB n=2 Tax=Thermomonospora echinospora TaxID=1992 RepID=A0A1H6A5M9_9ACTN|nr:pilus assembly protein CpaB [Thermomonospora echinospora]
MVLAGIGAVAVFMSIVGYVGSVRAEIGDMISVLRLRQPVTAYEPINVQALERVQVPRRWAPTTMISNPVELQGKVAAADLQAGTHLQRGMVVAAPTLQPGEREIAIMIDAETGVAGKVRPGMHVDIYATFSEQQQQRQRTCAARVIKQALVIQVGRLQEQREGQNAGDVNRVVPITFALTAKDSLKLTYAESYAGKVRLALIGQGDTGPNKLAPVCDTPLGQ